MSESILMEAILTTHRSNHVSKKKNRHCLKQSQIFLLHLKKANLTTILKKKKKKKKNSTKDD